MSLRLRLNLLITFLFISLFILGCFFIITNSRNAVHHEIESTARLALQLIQIATSSTAFEASDNIDKQLDILRQLSELDEIRHLHIDIQNASEIPGRHKESETSGNSEAPSWFVKLVEPPPIEIRHWLYNPTIPPTGIIIRADPKDEINENWNEVKSILIFLLIFIILANVLIYIAIGNYLAPIDTILNGLSGIEKGHYKNELPQFNLPELDRISQRFNHMSKVLLKSKAENQLLTQRSLEIQEEERRHLAQELHDELGQTITAIKAVAVAINNNQKNDKEQIDFSVKTIIEYSDHIYKVAKHMMHRLRPSVLDEFGLIKALQNMIDDWNSRQDDIFCHFDFSDIPEDIPEPLKINLFRIIQESLTNVQKHSSASDLEITIQCLNKQGKNAISLSIKDDGKGFDKDKMKPGFGLLGIKERVEMNNGQFELTSSINKGVSIEIKIPLGKC